jgi:hypothetical protein
MVTRAELKKNPSWVVAEGWVIDISDFVRHHPGGEAKILSASKQQGAFSFKTHFPSTGQAFREACEAHTGEPYRLTFEHSRLNGGLDCSGNLTGCATAGSVGSLLVLGKLQEEEKEEKEKEEEEEE